jgi:hypothetical protein
MTKPKYELYSTFGNCWLTVDVKTEAEVRQMAEDSEVMYKVNGVTKSWKNK